MNQKMILSVLMFATLRSFSADIASGGFEEGGVSGDWRNAVHANASAVYIQNGTAGKDVRSGCRAIAISNPVNSDERWYLRKQGLLSVKAGTQYEFSIWVKAESMSKAQTYVSLVWLNTSQQVVGSGGMNSRSISKDTDWMQTSAAGIAPAGAAFVRPTLVVKALETGSDAKVTFDDYRFFEVK